MKKVSRRDSPGTHQRSVTGPRREIGRAECCERPRGIHVGHVAGTLRPGGPWWPQPGQFQCHRGGGRTAVVKVQGWVCGRHAWLCLRRGSIRRDLLHGRPRTLLRAAVSSSAPLPISRCRYNCSSSSDSTVASRPVGCFSSTSCQLRRPPGTASVPSK